MIKIIKFIPALLVFSSFNSYASTHWSNMLKDDLAYIRETVKANHPGYLDSENPEFKAWFEIGYQRAIEQAEQVDSLPALMTVTSEYVAGFADGHFALGFGYAPKQLKWAGIALNKVGNDYQVTYVDENHNATMPPNLSRLVECEGLPVEDIMNTQVLKARFNAPTLNFPKVWYADKLLLDDGIGKRRYFEACSFELDGKLHKIPLDWQSISRVNYLKQVTRAQKASEFKFEEMAKNQYWVTLPTLDPDEDQLAQLRVVLSQIQDAAPNAEQIVVDVRGNGGGNSEWGVTVAKAIYGESYITQHQQLHPDRSYALWRVSKDNLNYLKGILPELEQQFGAQNELYIDFKQLTTDMASAMDNAIPFVKQGAETNNAIDLPVVKSPPATAARVLFLTDSSCGSSCLDFADLMLALPNVTHIGEETAADTVYMDVRIENLPSGLGRFSVAQKVYRDRARRHNQSYKPDFAYLGDLTDTEQVKRWIKSLQIVSK